MFQRSVTHIHHPLPHRGFMGPDHAARLLIDVDYKESDPFIMLADDRLVKTTNEPVGGPHPHAGFETVSLLLKGDMGDDRHRLKAGDLQLMTAGSGVIHTETIESAVDFHLLQLWLVLPKKERWAKPRVQDLAFEDVPLLKTTDYSMRLYSGAMAGLQSPITNYTPFIIADFELKGGATTIQNIPANYTAFLYVLDGKVIAGQEDHMVDLNRVAWFDKNRSSEASEI
ncbi:MAG TPA: pirin family protein, partial [Cytophagaceae bacterium]|nr:pirin family protein [Cytophagaceae bacterium]